MFDLSHEEWRLAQVNVRVENTLDQDFHGRSAVKSARLSQFPQLDLRLSPGHLWNALSPLHFVSSTSASLSLGCGRPAPAWMRGCGSSFLEMLDAWRTRSSSGTALSEMSSGPPRVGTCSAWWSGAPRKPGSGPAHRGLLDRFLSSELHHRARAIRGGQAHEWSVRREEFRGYRAESQGVPQVLIPATPLRGSGHRSATWLSLSHGFDDIGSDSPCINKTPGDAT